HCSAVGVGFGCHRSGCFVPDEGVERGHQRNGAIEIFFQPVGIGGNSSYAAVSQSEATASEVLEATEERVGNDGLECVELQLPRLGGHGNGKVVADHLEGDLVHDLGDHRI